MERVERRWHGGQLPLLQSTVLRPFVHGFTTREGGVSPAPYHSLNLGMRWGDTQENVLENRRRVRMACGADQVYLVRQIHGAAVLPVTADTPPELIAAGQADALISNVAGVALAVFTADCVPLLLADPTTGAVAAVHAGWRGVVAGVAPAAVAALRDSFGSRAADLSVALGPAIGPCCFEVGPEVVAAFDAQVPGARAAGALDQGGAQVGAQPGGRPHIDLKRALRVQLEAAGITSANIDAAGDCTMCDPAGRFYSYRRDNTLTGQHMSIIVAGVAAAGRST